VREEFEIVKGYKYTLVKNNKTSANSPKKPNTT
jgi:hypothetical protein